VGELPAPADDGVGVVGVLVDLDGLGDGCGEDRA
jgi:hypothetical protein